METILTYFPELDKRQLTQFKELAPLYSLWNDKINVISRKDMDHFYEHHVLHSLSIAKKFSFTEQMNVMDLGSGGGFPGIPLAILFPATRFLLVDSINKKLKVAAEIASSIGLDNIITRHIRAEDIKDKKFDVVVSRAVAPLKDLWKWSRPLLLRTGHETNGLICLKGGDLAHEISESGCKPRSWEIHSLFPEPFFEEKYLLQVPFK